MNPYGVALLIFFVTAAKFAGGGVNQHQEDLEVIVTDSVIVLVDNFKKMQGKKYITIIK